MIYVSLCVLEIFYVCGKLVKVLCSGTIFSGVHEETYSINNLSQNIYCINLNVNNQLIKKKYLYDKSIVNEKNNLPILYFDSHFGNFQSANYSHGLYHE